jgi:hypothetical protein
MPSITFCNLNLKFARYMYFKIRKFTSQNLVYQAAVFCVRNAPKVTYERLRFEKFFRGLYPRTPLKRGGGHEEGKEGWEGMERKEGRGRQGEGGKRKEGREESGAPRFKLVPPASLGLATALLRADISFGPLEPMTPET